MTQTNKLLLLASGVIGLGWFLSRQSGQASPFGSLFNTVMPQSATEAQRAAWFGANAGGSPSRMSTNGTGVTSVVPATVNAIAALGRGLTDLFARSPGPGNTAPPQIRPQASMGSGGGVDQPYGPTLQELGASYEITGEGMFWRDPITASLVMVPQTNPSGDGTIIYSDQGGYDVMTGEWFDIGPNPGYDDQYGGD